MSAQAENPTTLLGGKYVDVAELGRGGMGVVYKAYQKSLQRKVAIKCLNREFSANEDFLRRFQQEALVVARMSHENIVAVYDIEEYAGDQYIIMEFVEGESLGDRMNRERRVPFNEAVSIVRQTARALGHAHERGVVHRDVKPDNIMLAAGMKVKVMDFGIARVTEKAGQHTKTGMAIGTPHYMSPEQIEGRKTLDARSDLYSLAVVLFYIVTGELPFNDENAFTLAMKHIAEPPPRPSFINPSVPPALEAIILKGLAKNPDDRYQNADIFDQALGMFEMAMGGGTGTQGGMAALGQSLAMSQNLNAMTMAGSMPGAQHQDVAAALLRRNMGATPQAEMAAMARTPMQEFNAPPGKKKRSIFVSFLIFLFVVALLGGAGFGGFLVWKEINKPVLAADPAAIKKAVEDIEARLRVNDADQAERFITQAEINFGKQPEFDAMRQQLQALRFRLSVKLEQKDVDKVNQQILNAKYDAALLTSARAELEKLKEFYPDDTRLNELQTALSRRFDQASTIEETRKEVDQYISRDQFKAAGGFIGDKRRAIGDEAIVSELLDRVKRAQEREVDNIKLAIRAGIDANDIAAARAKVAEGRKRFSDLSLEWLAFEKQVNEADARLAGAAARVSEAAALKKQFDDAIAANSFEEARAVASQIRLSYKDLVSEDLERVIGRKSTEAADEYYKLGSKAEEANDLEKAVEYYEKAASVSQNLSFTAARDRSKKKLEDRDKVRSLILGAREKESRNDLRGAIKDVKEALDIEVFNKEAADYLKELEKKLQQDIRGPQITTVEITDPPELIAKRKREAPAGFLYIPGGNYRVGSNRGAENSGPQHIVQVKGFYIAETETTVDDYRAFVDKQGRQNKITMPNLPPSDTQSGLPITAVNKREAEAFCRAYNARLPTEFEWEIAASTAENWEYATGDNFNRKATNTYDNGAQDNYNKMAPARDRQFVDGWRDGGYPNGLRALYHMGGNVAEWTSSPYKPYPNGSLKDPGYDRLGFYTVRGGSYNDLSSKPEVFKASARRGFSDAQATEWIGFRVVKDPAN